jgi:hypothetical protein
MEDDEIIVTGHRVRRGDDDWSDLRDRFSFDYDILADLNLIALQGGGGAFTPALPDEEIVVTAQPSEGQEHFADDGDVFNDGEAPTYDTVLAWLEQLKADGSITVYGITARDANDPSAGYTGFYSTFGRRNFEFESDGETATNFLRSQPLIEPEPVDPRTIAYGGDGYDYWLV